MTLVSCTTTCRVVRAHIAITLSHFLTDTHPLIYPTSMSHVLSAGISDSVVDVNVLGKVSDPFFGYFQPANIGIWWSRHMLEGSQMR